MKSRYFYEGPVMQFGKVIQEKWWAETVAISEDKARNNLCYRWKKEHGRTAEAKIQLPGRMLCVG